MYDIRWRLDLADIIDPGPPVYPSDVGKVADPVL